MRLFTLLPNKRFQCLFNRSISLKNNQIFGRFASNYSNSKNCYSFQHYLLCVAWLHYVCNAHLPLQHCLHTAATDIYITYTHCCYIICAYTAVLHAADTISVHF